MAKTLDTKAKMFTLTYDACERTDRVLILEASLILALGFWLQ